MFHSKIKVQAAKSITTIHKNGYIAFLFSIGIFLLRQFSHKLWPGCLTLGELQLSRKMLGEMTLVYYHEPFF